MRDANETEWKAEGLNELGGAARDTHQMQVNLGDFLPTLNSRTFTVYARVTRQLTIVSL